MKKSMKRLLSLLCSFMLIVSALPVFTAFAEGETKAEGDMVVPDGVNKETFATEVVKKEHWTFTAPEGEVDYSGTDITWTNDRVTLTFEAGKALPKKVAFSADLELTAGGTKKFNASSNVASVVKRGDSGETITNTVDMTLAEDADLGVNNANNQIKGYQTELLNTYAIDVIFKDDAVYCYNRGTYNPETEKYEVKQGGETNTVDNYAEKGITANGGVYDVTRSDDANDDNGNKYSGKWFGFDGSQNLIVIVNRSNAGIKCKTTSSVDENIFKGSDDTNKGAIELFAGSGATWYEKIGLTQQNGSEDWKLSDFKGSAFTDKLDGSEATKNRRDEARRLGTGEDLAGKTGKETVCAGVTGNMPSVTSFYYNIKGRPETTLSSTGDGKFTSTKAEKIGTISLAFTAA